jgi:hypothetical protein
MKNVTISMDEATLAWVRVEAAKAGRSVSRWVGERLRDERLRDDDMAAASARIERLLAEGPKWDLSDNGKITIDRDEMYEHLLRRFDDPPLSEGSTRTGQGRARAGVAEDPDPYKPNSPERSGSD